MHEGRFTYNFVDDEVTVLRMRPTHPGPTISWISPQSWCRSGKPANLLDGAVQQVTVALCLSLAPNTCGVIVNLSVIFAGMPSEGNYAL